MCEWHPDKPWDGAGACGCGGAGMTCTCNPTGNVDKVFGAVYASTDPTNVKNWVQ